MSDTEIKEQEMPPLMVKIDPLPVKEPELEQPSENAEPNGRQNNLKELENEIPPIEEVPANLTPCSSKSRKNIKTKRVKKVRTPEEKEQARQRKLDALDRGRKTAHENRKKAKERLKTYDKMLSLPVPTVKQIDEDALVDRILERFKEIELSNRKDIDPRVKRMVPANGRVIDDALENDKLKEKLIEKKVITDFSRYMKSK